MFPSSTRRAHFPQLLIGLTIMSMHNQSLRTKLHDQRLTLSNLFAAGQLALELASETTPKIDEQFLGIARRVADQDGALFSVISPDLLVGHCRPDAIRHNRAFLPPNPISGEEVTETLSLIDIMLGEQVTEIQSVFAKASNDLQLFDRLEPTKEAPGSKFMIVSNHLQLSDQGFTMGFLHKVAKEQGIDRLENYLTAVIGRAIGYFQFGELNAVDDVLRKVGSVLKTFPSGGSEALTDEQKALMIFRGICNHHTRQSFAELLNSREGRILFMAPSGEQDKHLDDRGVISMTPFSKATCQMMIDACREGAQLVPIFVDYGNDASIVEFMDARRASNLDECHQIGQDVAMTGTILRGRASAKYADIGRFRVPINYG
jgi:hypothetical protein